MNTLTLYIGLLLIGIVCFVLHYVALFRITRRLRAQHPNQWQIIAAADGGKPLGPLRVWMRMQHVLRSPALPAMQDAVIDGWRRIWRFSPWLAWVCWFGALALQLKAR